MHFRTDLYARWFQDMRRKGFFQAGQRVGVAVSGGPDSVLLLHFMKLLAEEKGLTIAAVHFNHRLRGVESEGDEALVRNLAASLGIEFLRSEAEVAQIAHERRANLEAIARDLRYRFLFSLIDRGELDRVATAHTANDQAETVLMRILRGTGTRGLGGIFPVLEGGIVRPFLGLTRAEVMREVTARGLSYRVDSSNFDTRFRRNKIRTVLLPLLEKEFSPAIIPLLNQFADRARDDEACLDRLARDRAQPWRVRAGKEERIPVRALLDLPPALARRVLRQMLQAVRPATRGLTYDHIESLRRFAAEAQSGRTLTLPSGVVARREFAWLVVTAEEQGAKPDFCYPVAVPGELPVRELGVAFMFKILSRESTGKAYNCTKLLGLDPQKLGGDLILRNWRAGDRFCPLGSRGVRKLKELLREMKVPESRRKGWPVLLCAGKVVWVRGLPPGRDTAATDKTECVLIVEEQSLRLPAGARDQPA